MFALACTLGMSVGNVERVGWAFATHGGFPPTPSSWGYSGVVRDWSVAYFVRRRVQARTSQTNA